ncbi:LSU ribosomal protein L18p (L5e) [hydrothermal vent metagenome]|uniref:LSU ribosomal protein L18p (L5e) n=1 Tax=hydrothermal vent metagenome TaxID=652676 RepID=A0A3B1E140_9ZZZZ
MSRIKDLSKKKSLRLRRKKRIRGKISGSVLVPRLTVFKSNKYFYAQVIDDTSGNTLAAVDSRAMRLTVNAKNVVQVAVEFAKTLQSKKIKTVAFDRNGYLYHGVLVSFANTLRDNGIKV